MNRIVSKKHVEVIWDRLAGDDFQQAGLREVKVDGAPFQVLHVLRKEEFVPSVYLPTGLSFYAWPRLAAYKYRCVLVPQENMRQTPRWELHISDISDWAKWSTHMGHVITFSTLKSGASDSLCLHAQSFPLYQDGVRLSALPGLQTEPLIRFNQMPQFEGLEIHRLTRYPIPGLKIIGNGTPDGQRQVARKLFELALNYDGLKAFNLVLIPCENDVEAYFFPRRKSGQAIYGPQRWQIAALEVNGLMQAKTAKQRSSISAKQIKLIFREISLNEREFQDFLNILKTF